MFNFGEYAVTTISGSVYVDRNNNGTFDSGDAGTQYSAPNGGLTGVTVTLVGAVIGTALALLGMYDLLVPYLILLGTVIPPIGGVIMADFFFRYRGQYPRLADTRLPAFNWPGLSAYAVGTVAAFSSPWVAPLVGIAAAALTYVLLTGVFGARVANAPLQDL